MAVDLSISFLDLPKSVPKWPLIREALDQLSFPVQKTETIQKEDFSKGKCAILDKFTSQLEASIERVAGYKGPHETPEYRKISEELLGIQLQLDTSEDRDVRMNRRNMFSEINKQYKILAERLHPGGKCQDCS